MKIFSIVLVSVGLALCLVGNSRAQQSPAPSAKSLVLSLPPAELIRLLPPPPENWKLTTSSARSEITSVPALQTVATRDYLFEAPLAPNGAAPPPPKKTRVMLLDSGFDATNFFAFQNFKPDSTGPSGAKKYLKGDMRVVEVVRGNKRTFSVAVSDRFLAALITENLDDKEAAAWLGLLNLPALRSASESAPRLEIPKGVLPVAFLDELHPKANQVVETAYLTKEEEAARQAAYDKWAVEYLNSHPELKATIEKAAKDEANVKKQ